MKFDILNCVTGKFQVNAEIICSMDELLSVKIGLAVKAAIKAGAYLSGANLSGANLYGAYLYGAYLYGANFSRAYLYGANFSGVPIIDGGLRSDGYRFFLTNFPTEGPRIKAGCRDFTLEQARVHWQRTRAGTQIGVESMLLLDYLERMAEVRGMKERPVVATL